MFPEQLVAACLSWVLLRGNLVSKVLGVHCLLIDSSSQVHLGWLPCFEAGTGPPFPVLRSSIPEDLSTEVPHCRLQQPAGCWSESSTHVALQKRIPG